MIQSKSNDECCSMMLKCHVEAQINTDATTLALTARRVDAARGLCSTDFFGTDSAHLVNAKGRSRHWPVVPFPSTLDILIVLA